MKTNAKMSKNVTGVHATTIYLYSVSSLSPITWATQCVYSVLVYTLSCAAANQRLIRFKLMVQQNKQHGLYKQLSIWVENPFLHAYSETLWRPDGEPGHWHWATQVFWLSEHKVRVGVKSSGSRTTSIFTEIAMAS